MTKARGRVDLELFAHTFFPHHCKLPFSRMHHEYFQRCSVIGRGQKDATAAPRGYAKSTLEALVKPIHDLCYGLERFIVLISCTENQAIARIADIRNELLTNEALIYSYGPFFGSRVVASSNFIAQSSNFFVKVQGYGAGAEIRGIKWGDTRPTKIILDDVEHSTEVENEAIRSNQRDWFRDVVSKLGDNDTNICAIGTILHKDSLLKNLLKNPGFNSRLYKAVISFDECPGKWEQWRKIYTDLTNENRKKDSRSFFERNREEMLRGTKVLWPEKEDYYALQCEIVETGRRSFYKEKQNDPRSTDRNVFDLNSFDYFTVDSTGRIHVESDGRIIEKAQFVGRFGVLDPSHGQGRKPKKGALPDFASLLTGVVDSYGYLYVMSDWTRRLPPTKQIHAIFDHHDIWHYDKFGIESNLFRELMLDDIRKEKEKREKIRKAQIEARKSKEPWGIRIAWYDIVNTEKKEARIYSLEPKVMNGFIKFNRALSEEFYNQIEAFPFGDNDDAPDALHMLWNLADRKYEARAVNLSAMER